jgi:hypothetical protein
MQKKVSKTNLAGAETAEERGSKHAAATEAEADRGSGKTVPCFRQFAPSAVRRPQSPLNRVEIGPFTAGIVSATGEIDTRQIKAFFPEANIKRPLFYCPENIMNIIYIMLTN